MLFTFFFLSVFLSFLFVAFLPCFCFYALVGAMEKMFLLFFPVCMVTYSKSIDQPGKVANPARGQLNRKLNIFLSPFAPENLVPRDGFSRPVPRQPPHSPYSG